MTLNERTEEIAFSAPPSAPTISSEKICCATNLLLPSFAPSYQTGLIWGSKLQGQICCTSLFQEQAPSCVLKFACREMTCKTREQKFCCATYFFTRNRWCRRGSFAPGACCRSVLREQAPSSCPSCVLVGFLTRKRVSGACFRSKLPRVYRLLQKPHYSTQGLHECCVMPTLVTGNQVT